MHANQINMLSLKRNNSEDSITTTASMTVKEVPHLVSIGVKFLHHTGRMGRTGQKGRISIFEKFEGRGCQST